VSGKMTAIAAGAIAVIVALAVALVVVIASSGDDDEGPENAAPGLSLGSSPGGHEVPVPEELEAFRQCMRDEGIDIPEPGEAPPSDPEAVQEGFTACRDRLPQDFGQHGGAPGGSMPFIFPGG
jgi:hypothetical protein